MMTGYPSIDKPWLKYYSEEAINTPLPQCTMYELIYNRNQDNLDRVALDYYGTKMTYAQMFQEIAHVACTLESSGVKKGDIVTICMMNSLETILLLFALNKIGAVANMVYGSSTPEELKKCILDTKSTLVFTLDIFQEKFLEFADTTEIRQMVVTCLSRSMTPLEKAAVGPMGLDQFSLPNHPKFFTWEQFFLPNNGNAAVCHDTEAAAVITYTGGTTGGSKGVILSNRAVVAVAVQYAEDGLRRESTWVQSLPLFVAYGVTGSLMTPLAVGMTLIVRLTMTDSILDLCKTFRPNHILYGPVQWEMLSDSNENLDLSYLVAPISGGDTLSPAVETKVNEFLQKNGCHYPIMNGYGMTEVGAAVAVNYQRAHKLGSVGIPFVKNVIAAFDTESGKELKYGQEGELCICTPSMMTEYISNPEETDNIIRRHEDGKLWVHSGDLGYISEDGFVHISGRLKRYMLCIAENVQKKVYSLDVEKVLLQYPKVSKCAVVPVASEKTFQAPAAFVVLKQEYEAQEIESELKSFCEGNLPTVYQPVRYIFVDKFPLTKVGKVDYRALEKIAAEQ